MKAVGNRAGLGGRLDDSLLLRSEIAAFREVEVYLYFNDTPRVCAHYLFSFYGSAFKGEAVAFCADAHNGEHAAAQGRGQKVSGGEALSLAVVVQRSIGEDGCSALEMGDLVAEVALVSGEHLCHIAMISCFLGYFLPFLLDGR